MDKVSDEQLFQDYRSGDNGAFARLVRRYERELFNFLLRFMGKPALAEEVFQEAFLQVHIAADSFQENRKFKPWLYTIAANKARDALRRRARRPAVQITASGDDKGTGDLWDTLLQHDETAADVLEAQEQRERVRRTVAGLPDHFREILTLAYFEQFAYKEMAEILEIPLGTVKSRLHAAVAAFAKAYQQGSPEAKDE